MHIPDLPTLFLFCLRLDQAAAKVSYRATRNRQQHAAQSPFPANDTTLSTAPYNFTATHDNISKTDSMDAALAPHHEEHAAMLHVVSETD
jgi:hypothetical protein